MKWLCRILGHDGPYWLDVQHQGHCKRCREPHPTWLASQLLEHLLSEQRTTWDERHGDEPPPHPDTMIGRR